MSKTDNGKKPAEIQNLLQAEGINAKGYGIIPKFAMVDIDLDIYAKGIYAYFCCLSGSKDQAFPSLSRILYDLQIAESTYYKYYNQLIKHEYIRTRQEITKSGTFSRNIITLVSNPKKFIEEFTNNTDIIRFQGIKSAGYGMIPRAVMFDHRLDIKAKAIYAYFCTFTGSGNSAFPQRSKILYHLNLSKSTYYGRYNDLIKYNYLSVDQKHVDGKLSFNIYYLNEFPDVNTVKSKKQKGDLHEKDQRPNPQGSDANQCPNSQGSDTNLDFTGNLQCPNLQCPDLQCPNLQCTDTQCTDTQGTIINSFSINSFDNNQSINLSKNSTDGWTDPINHSNNFKILLQNKKCILNEIIQHGELPLFFRDNPQKLIDAIKLITNLDLYYETKSNDAAYLCVQALIDLCLMKTSITLKDSHVTYSRVFEAINRNLVISKEGDYATINEVIESATCDFKKAMKNTKIKDQATYMKACLWNSLNTNRLEYENNLRLIGSTSYDDKEE